MDMKNCEFWFVVGSQFLYGPEVLETVAQRAAEMADTLNKSGNLPCKVVYKATVKTDAEITQVMKDANYDENCCGVITWCHTFSPSKMWIHGFGLLQKPYCHLATQYTPRPRARWTALPVRGPKSWASTTSACSRVRLASWRRPDCGLRLITRRWPTPAAASRRICPPITAR